MTLALYPLTSLKSVSLRKNIKRYVSPFTPETTFGIASHRIVSV